jgi:hypothetical protein
MIPKGLPTNILTKNIKDSYKICNLIIIIIVGVLTSVRYGLFKMLKLNHMSTFLPLFHPL